MYYYKKHIQDFDAATRHLTRIERSVYSDLIEMYYSTEKQLPLDVALIARKIIATGDEDFTAVKNMLSEFFVLTDEGYFNKRCQEEVDQFQTSIKNKSKAGRESAKSRIKQRKEKGITPGGPKSLTSRRETGVEQVLDGCSTVVANHKPITINQEPYINEDFFIRFWSAGMTTGGCSKKTTRLKFKAAHKKSNLEIAEFTNMLCEDISARIKSNQFGFDKLHPTTYLNQERWRDDRAEAKDSAGVSPKLSAADRVKAKIQAEFGP